MPKLPSWTVKYSLKSVNGRKLWYKTEDGGFSWSRVSQREVLHYIALNGVVVK